MATYRVENGVGIIPEGTTVIEKQAFVGCSDLVSVIIPDSVTIIGECAFTDCTRLTSVIIPDSVTKIEIGAFANCTGLMSVELPSNLKEIEYEAFFNCSSLAHVVLPFRCIVGEGAFTGVPGLTEAVLCVSQLAIYDETFYNCRGLTKVVIPDSVITIGKKAFMGCTNLNEVAIPESLEYIDDEAFAGCTGLKSMVIYEFYDYDNSESRRRTIGSNIVDNRLLEAFNYVIDRNLTRRIVDNGNCIGVEMIDETAEDYDPVWIPDKVFEMLHEEHECVDLGLSVKWATCNVGASSPSDYGSYFAWGETTPKNEYSWASLRYCADYSGDTFTKYNNVDNKSRLELGDDAARANWGGSWRMPTDAEWTELRQKCTWVWTEQGGKKGYKVTSKVNGNSIFLPAAGCLDDVDLYNEGSDGYYWSSSLSTDNPDSAWLVYFGSDDVDGYGNYRHYGNSVRPVSE